MKYPEILFVFDNNFGSYTDRYNKTTFSFSAHEGRLIINNVKDIVDVRIYVTIACLTLNTCVKVDNKIINSQKIQNTAKPIISTTLLEINDASFLKHISLSPQ